MGNVFSKNILNLYIQTEGNLVKNVSEECKFYLDGGYEAGKEIGISENHNVNNLAKDLLFRLRRAQIKKRKRIGHYEKMR